MTEQRRQYRSSQSGQYIGEEAAKANPDTTQSEVDTLGIFKAQIRVILDIYDQTGDVIQMVSTLRGLVGE